MIKLHNTNSLELTPGFKKPFFNMLRGNIESITREFGNTYTYRLKIPQGFHFVPGQYVHLMAPGGGLGEGMVRHMSIASTPEDGELVFSMDLSSRTPFKQRFAEAKVGDELRLFRIKGEFTLDHIRSGDRLLFIAGGIGITPFRSLIRHIDQAGMVNPWSLMYVGRNYLFTSDIDEAVRRDSLQRSVHYIGRKEIPETLGRLMTGDTTKAANQADMQNLQCFIGGSEGFVESLKRMVIAQGVSEEHIRLENFNH